MPNKPRIVIAGAGSIGCYVGGLLTAQGLNVSLLGRERIIAAITAQGLALTDADGLDLQLSAQQLSLTTDPKVLAEADLILIATKSLATESIAAQIKQYGKPSAQVLSLQNGVKNPQLLRQVLDQEVTATIVPFNVVQTGAASFHRGTFTPEILMEHKPELSELLSGDYMQFRSELEFTQVQWGKLLLNLNNVVNALSDLPIREQLSSRPWRCLMAEVVAEAIVVCKAADIKFKSVAPVSMENFCRILRLPTFLFKIAAASMLKIDPKARASMWEDLNHRRATEVDEFQGVIIELGRKHNIATPLNQRLYQAVKVAEQRGEGSPALAVSQLQGG